MDKKSIAMVRRMMARMMFLCRWCLGLLAWHVVHDYDSGMTMIHYDGGFWAGTGDTGNYHQALSGSHQQVLMAE